MPKVSKTLFSDVITGLADLDEKVKELNITYANVSREIDSGANFQDRKFIPRVTNKLKPNNLISDTLAEVMNEL